MSRSFREPGFWVVVASLVASELIALGAWWYAGTLGSSVARLAIRVPAGAVIGLSAIVLVAVIVLAATRDPARRDDERR